MEVPLSPIDFLRRARKLYGHREAVVDGDLRFTYAQLGERCDRWSNALATLGVGVGDRVSTLSPNTHQHLEQYYAVPQLGAVIVPWNFRLSAEDFVYLANHSGTKVLCAHTDYLAVIDRVRERMPTVKHFVALEGDRSGWLNYEALIESAWGKFHRQELDESALVAINYTSGTTSTPKGVMITHRNAWTNSIGALIHLPMTAVDRYLWTLPMFHANGWTYTWTVTAAGGTHVCLRRLEASAVCRLIGSENISIFCAAPTVLIAIASSSDAAAMSLPRGVRVITGGASPPPAVIEQVEKQFGWIVTQVYGLTETSPFISICEPVPADQAHARDDVARRKARQGVELITSGEMRVVDGNLNDVVADGKMLGEVIVRGNAVMKGYYRDLDATEKALRNGFFHTGDAAVVHVDGYIEIRDRFKDIIISGGENISTIEVEAAIIKHEAVLEVAVIGMPDERWGETPHAFVLLKPGKHTTAADLSRSCRKLLAHFKVPTAFVFVQDLPRTATGKIQKNILRDIHRPVD